MKKFLILLLLTQSFCFGQINIGSTPINNVKVGNEQVSKVYHGNDLVWPFEAWEQIKALAQADGWYAVYNFDQANTITLNSGKVASISDALATLPNQVQATSANQPTLTANAIGSLDAAVFTGTQNLNIATATPKAAPLFIMTVYQYDGALSLSASQFMHDGSANTTNSRASLIASATGNFAAYGFTGGEKAFAALDNNPHITGVEYRTDTESQIWHDGAISTITNIQVAAPISLLRIGSDYLGARKLNGKVAAILIYDGSPDVHKIQRMFKKLSSVSNIAMTTGTITCPSYGTMKVSDGSMVQNQNENTILNVASLTKLMAVTVAADYISNYSTSVTINSADAGVRNDPSQVNTNDVLTLTDLIGAAMVYSDNVAAAALGRIVGQIVNPTFTNAQANAWFVNQMNAKAVTLGMANTSYTRADHMGQSTVADQLKLMRHIQLNVAKIREYWGLSTYNMTITGANARTYILSTTTSPARLRRLMPEFVGGKDGFIPPLTNMAFTWTSYQDGELYITVTLNSTDGNKFLDTRRVIDKFYNLYN